MLVVDVNLFNNVDFFIEGKLIKVILVLLDFMILKFLFLFFFVDFEGFNSCDWYFVNFVFSNFR